MFNGTIILEQKQREENNMVISYHSSKKNSTQTQIHEAV